MNVYMGREIAPLLSCNAHSSAWLSREERWIEEKPQLLFDALSIRRGMTVADVGAGTGFMTMQLARQVGRRGLVVASDLQSEMLDTLLDRPNLPDNIVAVLSSPVDPGLAPNTFDLILMVDVYHEAPRPDLLLKGLRRALKPNGRLALVEYRKEDPQVPIDPRHKMSARQVIRELHANRFRLVQQFEHLPWQHLFIFIKQ
jgi:ubiquinone/menaquinone biosynthesis C-methylase UbiE